MSSDFEIKNNTSSDYAFFSYSHQNKEEVYKIKSMCDDAGYNIVLDTEMSKGDMWPARAKEFIRNNHCKAVLFFISDDSAKSQPVLKELGFVERYEKDYCAVLLDNEDVETKFDKINSSDALEEEKDVVDQMMDYFPNEKLYILNNSELMDGIQSFFNGAGLVPNKDAVNNFEVEHISSHTDKQLDKQLIDDVDYIIVEGDDITPRDIQSALNLEKRFLDIEDDEQFDLDKCLNWFNKNKWIYTFLEDAKTREVVAHIDAEPVTDECYADILTGKYPDIEIDDDDVESFDIPGFYNLYFASIVADQKYKDISILFKLYDAFVSKLIMLSKNGINIRRMVADAVSKNGKRICKMFGMKKVKETEHDSEIYEVSLIPPEFSVTSKLTKELYDTYEEKAIMLGLLKK